MNKENVSTVSGMRGLQPLILVFAAVILCPLIGSLFATTDFTMLIQFPPRVEASPPPFSPRIFIFLLTASLGVIALILLPLPRLSSRKAALRKYNLPFFGAVSLFSLFAFWMIAWTRFPAFSKIQAHTFFPLWLSYIVLASALSKKRTGVSSLTHRRKEFLLLFPVSSVFWWSFEFLNRWVHNWKYLNVEQFSSGEYIVFASLSFSTVLPAILATKELLQSYGVFIRLEEHKKISFQDSKIFNGAACFLSLLSLVLIPRFPSELFPFLWISPLFLLTSLQFFFQQESLFTPLASGNWSKIFLWAAAGLFCGLLWELWNFLSYAKWIYDVPYVGAFYIFEMPLLGYLGYLPFGIFCGALIEILLNKKRSSGEANTNRGDELLLLF